MKISLILIDIQNDYFPNGRNELHKPEEALECAKQALGFFRKNNLPVYYIRHTNIHKGATFFLPDTSGAEIHKGVSPRTDEKVFVKHAPNSFFQTDLNDELRKQNITHLVIYGMMSHMCIDTTVRAAREYGFSVTVLEDACATKDLCRNGTVIPADIVHNTIMASLDGVFAQVMTTQKFFAGANTADLLL